MTRYLTLWLVLATLVANPARAQLVRCTSDSPERQGKPGCTIVGDKRLPAPRASPALWHLDEFSSLAQAQQAEGPWSLAIEAYGRGWLCRETRRLHSGCADTTREVSIAVPPTIAEPANVAQAEAHPQMR